MPDEPSREAAWRDLCADLEPETQDNLLDSRGLHRKRRRKRQRGGDWRDRRLCGQARRAVQWGLAECGDPLMQRLIVLGVEPTETSSCLCVHLLHPPTPDAGQDAPDGVEPLLARLHAVAPHLRAEMTRGMRRKKTPNLVFRVHTQEPERET